jgi:hypothetical protein
MLYRIDQLPKIQYNNGQRLSVGERVTAKETSTNQAMHPSRRSSVNLNHSFLAATWVIANVLAYATSGSHRARAQSALADGARNLTRRVHGINATSVTAHKPPFPYSRIMLLISIRLSITKFLPDQRVDQDGMIQLLDRSIDRARARARTRKTARTKPCTEVTGRPRSILETTSAATR